jgi:NarL family two-component system sensor histidine kinase LiaS
MKKIKRVLSRLQSKLTITYTLVTVLALIAVEVILFSGLITLYIFSDTYTSEYISDVLIINSSQASRYLSNPDPDMDGFRTWLEEVYESGYASLPPQNNLDSPAAKIIPNFPIYVLSPEQEILMTIPEDLEISTSIESYSAEVNKIIKNYEANSPVSYFGDPLEQFIELEDGSLLIVVPVTHSEDNNILAYLLINVASPPPFLATLGIFLLTTVFLTGLILIIIITPFGALFGYVMARNLTRRIGNISSIVEEWGQDNFSQMPADKSADEIGDLARNLRKMAKDFQLMLQTRQELSRLEERNRLARELHDTVKQQVFATMMQVRAAKNSVVSNPNSAIQQLEEAEKLIKASQQELGLMINKMRPSDEKIAQNLPALLNSYLHNWQTQTKIKTNIDIVESGSVDFMIRQNLLRIFQEALSNISKHSQASKVDIKLIIDPEIVTLEIMDNGVGFIQGDDQLVHNGFGLESMQQRVKNIDGVIEIISDLNIGTTIRVTAPRSLEE